VFEVGVSTKEFAKVLGVVFVDLREIEGKLAYS